MEIKKLIKKYAILAAGLIIIRVVIGYAIPDLFTTTIVGEGFEHVKPTFLRIHQATVFNIILASFMALDLRKHLQHWFIIPVLTIFSLIAGLFFFGVLMLQNLITKHGSI